MVSPWFSSKVLELGAGAAALPSIVAARYGGAKHVLATDGLEDGGLCSQRSHGDLPSGKLT
jgi:hypothetical protein